MSESQRRILSLLNCQLTQADVAKKLKVSRSYVCQTVKRLEKLNLIKRIGAKPEEKRKNYNSFYELSPELKGKVKKEIEVIFTPYRAHRFIRKFHIINQSGPVSIDKRACFMKSKKIKGPERQIFWFPGKAGLPSVTIEWHPHTLMAYVDKGQNIAARTSEEAKQLGWQAIYQARDRFVEKQRLFGVQIETENVGTQVGKVHMGAIANEGGPLDSVKKAQDKVPESRVMGVEHPVWIDKSVQKELGPGAFEIEMFEDHPALTPVEETMQGIAEFKEAVPKALQEFNKKLDPLNENVLRVEAMLQGGITISQQYEQMVNFMTKALDEMAAIRRENAELKARLGI